MLIDSVHIKNSSGEELHVLNALGDEAFFGRDPNKCQIKFAPTAKGVSRIHASLVWRKTGLFLCDKSTYGSILDGCKVTNAEARVDNNVASVVVGEETFSVEIREKQKSPEKEESFYEGTSQESAMEIPEEEAEVVPIFETFSLGMSKNRLQRKRKPDEPVIEAVAPLPRGRRGPFTAPAAKQRVVVEEEPVIIESKSLTVPKVEEPDVPCSSTKPVKSPVKQNVEVVRHSPQQKPLEDAQHSDRGPYRANETIKYANLIFHQPDEKKPEISMINNVPNFKRFKPKSHQPGQNTSISYFNNTSISNRSNVSIQMVDAKLLK